MARINLNTAPGHGVSYIVDAENELPKGNMEPGQLVDVGGVIYYLKPDRKTLKGVSFESTPGSATFNDKNITSAVTVNDGDSTGVSITGTPLGYVQVMVNGRQRFTSYGSKLGECYWSGDGGTTARASGAVVAGDILYWNGSIAGIQLSASDLIDLNYSI